MSKLMFAMALAIAMTVTASAHIWNRTTANPSVGPANFRINPCPVSYAFQRGFCVRAATGTR